MVAASAFVLLAALLAVSGVGVGAAGGEEISRPDNSPRHCACAAVECQCCVDFNITYIDLGGPGCVKMKYLSQDEGISVNVSYGDSQLHEGHVKAGGNVSATCMNILLDLAQMCATFSSVSRTENGLVACASLEPTLLGDPQDSYHLGCFEMGPTQMRLIPASPVRPTESQSEPEDTQPVSFLEAVNESAEDGIAWFTNFWGINFIKPTSADNSTNSAQEAS